MLTDSAFVTALLILISPLVVIAIICLRFIFLRTVWIHLRKDLSIHREQALNYKTAVVLCCRGADEQLTACLVGLFRQSHKNYDIFVIVDHIQDASYELVHHLVREHRASNVTIEVLKNRKETCSLKCSAIVQLLELMDKDYEVCAFIDSDVISYPDWLRDLLVEFHDKEVALTFGTRWFMAPRCSLALMIRHAFGICGAVGCEFMQTPWGGSLAMRYDALNRPDVIEKLSNAFVEDTVYFGIVRSQGKKLKLAHDVVMPNAGDCSFPGIYYWCRRQYLGTRLYYPFWALTNLISLLVAVSILGQLVLLGITLYASNYWQLIVLLQLAALQYIMFWMILGVIDSQLTSSARQYQPELRSRPNLLLRSFISVAGCVLLPQILAVHVYAIREVTWRGIHYRIDGPWKITRLNYENYRP